MSLHDAKIHLAKAKDAYQRELGIVDSHLQRSVSADPAVLPEARAIQDGYASGFVAGALRTLSQPDAPAPAGPEPAPEPAPPEHATPEPVRADARPEPTRRRSRGVA